MVLFSATLPPYLFKLKTYLQGLTRAGHTWVRHGVPPVCGRWLGSGLMFGWRETGHREHRRSTKREGIINNTCKNTLHQCQKLGKIFTGPTYKLLLSFTVISDVYRYFLQARFQNFRCLQVQSTPVISRLLGAKIHERELSGSPVISRCRAKATTREFRITDPHSQAFTTRKQYVER